MHAEVGVTQRFGHRLRWTVSAVLFIVWFAALITNVGGAGATALLVAAIVVLLYELLAADRTTG